MRNVVWLRESFPPYRRLCCLSTATDVDRSFHVMSPGQAVFEIAASDPYVGEVVEGRMVEIEGVCDRRRTVIGIPDHQIDYLQTFAIADQYLAMPYVTPPSGVGYVNSVSIALGCHPSGPPTEGTVRFKLHSDNAGAPGTLLATSTNTLAVNLLTTYTVWFRFTFPSSIPLSANTKYWIALDSYEVFGHQNSTHFVRWFGIRDWGYLYHPLRSLDYVTWLWTEEIAALLALEGEWKDTRQAVQPWIGWIDRLEERDDGLVTVQCVDAAAKLGERHSGLTTSRSGCAGLIARELLHQANFRNAFGIIWDPASEAGSPVADIDVSASSLSAALNKLADATGDEWWFEYVVSPDRLEIMLHWGRQQGFDLSRTVCLRAEINKFAYARDSIEQSESVLVLGAGGLMSERPGIVRSVNQPGRAGMVGVVSQASSETQRRQQAAEPALASERVIVSARETGIATLAQIAERDLETPEGSLETVSMTVSEQVDFSVIPVGSIVRIVHDTAWGTLKRNVRIMEMQPGDGDYDLEVKVLNE